MAQDQKQPVIAVVGATASGKTALGIALAQAFDGEIVSADSMQIYKGLDIATAKPTPEERSAAPHHLISILDRGTRFSVAEYVALAREKIAEIRARGRLPIVVGGTGLYLNALLEHIQFAEMGQDESLRAQLAREAEEQGAAALHARLAAVDPETAAAVHPNNLPRVIRALEVYTLTGRPLSEFRKESRSEPSPYDVLWIGIGCSDRQLLYDRIDRRVDLMLEQGLLDEVRAVYEAKQAAAHPTADAAIGYKELIPYLEGAAPLEDCVEKIKQETRRYAKRQGTWFRKNEQIWWIYRDKFDEEDKILSECKKRIAKRYNL